MKLETTPETSRASSGVIGVKMIITGMANCGERGEKGGEKAFLAPTGAQEMLIFVHPSVCLDVSV